MNERAQKTVDAALSQMGGPYVFGAWGDECTPSLRRKYQKYNPEHAEAIAKKCQVLNGSKAGCAGCKWQHKLAFDCRGFTHWVLEQVGIDLEGSGATSQYKGSANWTEQWGISCMPDVPCCVFKQSEGKMQHTGYHIGGGRIIHCSAGVQEGRITDKGWTHYAIPRGLYTQDEIAKAGLVAYRPNLRKGDKGPMVKEMQERLLAAGHPVGDKGADGVFGMDTLAALRDFQLKHALDVDGICGPKTWEALAEAEEEPNEEPGAAVEPVQTGDKAALLEAVEEAMNKLREAVKACLGAVDE